MTGPGHRVLNFMLIGALTRSLPAALFGGACHGASGLGCLGPAGASRCPALGRT